MKFITNKIQFIARGLLIAGILSGLFISSGEGIQLFPFPGDFGKARQNSARFENGNSKKYSFSVHNSAAPHAVAKNKVQKAHKFFEPAGAVGGVAFIDAQFFPSDARQNAFTSFFYKAARLAAAPSNRAPPVV